MTQASIESLLRDADELARKAEWGDAFQTLRKACELDPLNPSLLASLGTFLVRTGRVKEAIPILEKAVTVTPDRPAPLVNLGAALAFAQRNAESAEKLFAALRMDPGCAMATKLLIVILAGEGRLVEANDLIARGIGDYPDDPEMLLLRASSVECNGDDDAARAAYEKVLEADPGNTGAKGALIRLSWKTAKRDTARSIVMLVDNRRIDRRVLDEALSLGRAGWSVTVIAGEPPDENPFWDEECYPEVEIVRIGQAGRLTVSWTDAHLNVYADIRPAPVPRSIAETDLDVIMPDTSWRPWFFRNADYYLEALRRPAAICVAHDLSQLPAAAMVAHHTGAYLVYDAHELFPDQYSDKAVWSQLRSMETHLIPFADMVITVNESISEVMRKRYGVSANVILNCPAMDPAALPVPKSNRIRDGLGIPAGMKILLYQGGLVTKKRNLETLIEAMALVARKDIVLVLMGPDGGTSKAQLSALARERGVLGSRVFFHESVRQSELLSYTASADAGIIPYPALDLLNQYYCTPNKTFEFLVAGLPILANDLPELNRFVSGLGAGVNMPMGNAEQIALAIETFFSSDLDAIRARVRPLSSRYVWDTQGEKIVSLYGGLAGAGPKAARALALETIEAHLERGEYGPARTLLRGRLVRNGNDVAALTNRGILEYLVGEPAAALNTLRRALALEPGNAVLTENITTIEESLRRSSVVSAGGN